MKKRAKIVPADTIESRIRTIRGQKVILDADLAAIYGVQTKDLNRAIKRNSQRFPPDFSPDILGNKFRITSVAIM